MTSPRFTLSTPGLPHDPWSWVEAFVQEAILPELSFLPGSGPGTKLLLRVECAHLLVSASLRDRWLQSTLMDPLSTGRGALYGEVVAVSRVSFQERFPELLAHVVLTSWTPGGYRLQVRSTPRNVRRWTDLPPAEFLTALPSVRFMEALEETVAPTLDEVLHLFKIFETLPTCQQEVLTALTAEGMSPVAAMQAALLL